MDQLKKYITIAVAASLAILAGGWFLLVSPKNAEAQALTEQAAEQVSANAALETQLGVLRAQAKDLPKKQADIARVAAKIPDNPSLPSLIRDITSASAASGVELVSITPGAPVAPVAVAPVAPKAPAAAQTTPTTAAPAPVPAGSLSTIPVAVNVIGEYFDVTQFLALIEDQTRALRFTIVAVAPGKGPTANASDAAVPNDGKTLSVLLTGRVFMAANRPVPTAVVAPGASTPATTTAATPTTPSAPTAPAS